MKEDQLTPDESLKLISSIISEAKVKFEEDGVIYVMWGLLASLAAFTQYYLIQTGNIDINYYPYFLMPLGAIYSGYYYSKKRDKGGSVSPLGKVISISWITVSVNIMIFGFLFGGQLGPNLIPLILVLMGFGIIISGVILQYNLLFISGIVMNLIGIIGMSFDYGHQPLLLGIATLICVFLPGVFLMIRHKKR